MTQDSCMPPFDTAAAISTHLAWAASFRYALKSRDARAFDLDRAFDDTACELGQWLQSDDSRVLGPDGHTQVARLHRRFHEAAFVLASIYGQEMHARDVEPFVVEFEGLSAKLVGLLRQSQGD